MLQNGGDSHVSDLWACLRLSAVRSEARQRLYLIDFAELLIASVQTVYEASIIPCKIITVTQSAGKCIPFRCPLGYMLIYILVSSLLNLHPSITTEAVGNANIM